MILVPHGGPHSVMPTVYLPSYAFLVASYNCAILHVNYRGSTGFGAANLRSLPGKCGRQDVDDMMNALDNVLSELNGTINPDKIAVVGGSHGGFLGGHLVGQYPNRFKAAALRNPVFNIPAMVTATDIPDWCFIEGCGVGSYNFEKGQVPTREQMIQMYDSSPVRYAENIITPTLIALGMCDRRVPKSQGLELYHYLKGKNTKTDLIAYPKDVHAIDKPLSEADHWLSIADWVHSHLLEG